MAILIHRGGTWVDAALTPKSGGAWHIPKEVWVRHEQRWVYVPPNTTPLVISGGRDLNLKLMLQQAGMWTGGPVQVQLIVTHGVYGFLTAYALDQGDDWPLGSTCEIVLAGGFFVGAAGRGGAAGQLNPALNSTTWTSAKANSELGLTTVQEGIGAGGDGEGGGHGLRLTIPTVIRLADNADVANKYIRNFVGGGGGGGAGTGVYHFQAQLDARLLLLHLLGGLGGSAGAGGTVDTLVRSQIGSGVNVGSVNGNVQDTLNSLFRGYGSLSDSIVFGVDKTLDTYHVAGPLPPPIA